MRAAILDLSDNRLRAVVAERGADSSTLRIVDERSIVLDLRPAVLGDRPDAEGRRLLAAETVRRLAAACERAGAARPDAVATGILSTPRAAALRRHLGEAAGVPVRALPSPADIDLLLRVALWRPGADERTGVVLPRGHVRT